MPSYSRRKVVDRMIRTLDEMTHLAGKRLWVEKTPDHLRHIETIAMLVEGSCFLHLIRDGRAVVASLQDSARTTPPNRWKGFDDVDFCIEWWNRSMEITARYIDQPRHLVCSYEHLVANPAAELDRICNFLGIDYESAMLRDRAQAARDLVTEGETWKKSNLAQDVAAVGLSKYERMYEEQEMQHIEERLNLALYHSMLRKINSEAISQSRVE